MTCFDCIKKIKLALYMIQEVETCEIEPDQEYDHHTNTLYETLDIKIRYKREGK